MLDITVSDGDKVLYSGTAESLSREGVKAADDTLKINERKTLTVTFRFPEEKGNEAQNLDLQFTPTAFRPRITRASFLVEKESYK